MSFLRIFTNSARELKNIRCVVTIGVLLAVAVVLDGFGSIRFGEYLKINFAFLPLAMVGILFGPVAGGAAGMLTDLVGYLINPTAGFIPALMLVTGLEGFIYGLILYNIKGERTYQTVIRVVLARLIVCTLCNLTLNTLVLYSCGFITGESFGVVFGARIATNIITFCLGSYMMMAVIIPVKIFYDRHLRFSRANPAHR